MKELELKHLAGYLPYGLKCTDGELIGIRNHIGWTGEFKFEYGSNHIPLKFIKPILRPLSDLKKEIEVNGERFIPCDKLISLTNYGEDYKKTIFWEHKKLTKNTEFISFKSSVCKEFIVWISNIDSNEYRIIKKLLEWHFDLYSLIENNLAIDINTLNN